MEEENEKENIKMAVEKLFAGYFDPTDKPHWIKKLVDEGLNQEDAKRAYKIAANRYHLSRNEKNNRKSSFSDKVVNVAKYSAAGIFTFGIMPYIYIFLVLVVIAILGFIFGF